MDSERVEAYMLGAVGAAKGVWEHYVKPEVTAERAWAIIGLGVLAYELAAPKGQLLSEGCHRAIEKHPWAVRSMIGVTALHLAGVLPKQIDPFALTTGLLKKSE